MVKEILIDFFQSWPPWLGTMAMGATPVAELRGAIPIAYALVEKEVWSNFPIYLIYIFAVIGNMLPVLPILYFYEPVSNWMRRRWKTWDRFFDWLYKRTDSRSDVVKKYEALGLTIFVAIPLPITGAWTGCLAAIFLHIKYRRAIPCIGMGVLISGVIVTILTLGVGEAVSRLF
jgi:uncharacterized membrane protein